MPETDSCGICSDPAETVLSEGYDGIHRKCPRCGEFRLSGKVRAALQCSSHKFKLSGWIRNQNMLSAVPDLTSDCIKRIDTAPIPGVIERANSFLIHSVRCQDFLGGKFKITDPALQVVTYSQNLYEIYELCSYLEEERFILQLERKSKEAQVTLRGFMRYEELQACQSASTQGFVAMCFNEKMHDVYENGFAAGIQNAGYDPLRVDRVEHNRKIDDEIIANIRRSRFVVADFTGHRGGVYLEAGFAWGLNLPVFLTCRKDEIDNLHFDIRQFNCIGWVETSKLAERLQNRIEAVIGRGPIIPIEP